MTDGKRIKSEKKKVKAENIANDIKTKRFLEGLSNDSLLTVKSSKRLAESITMLIPKKCFYLSGLKREQ